MKAASPGSNQAACVWLQETENPMQTVQEINILHVSLRSPKTESDSDALCSGLQHSLGCFLCSTFLCVLASSSDLTPLRQDGEMDASVPGLQFPHYPILEEMELLILQPPKVFHAN